MKTILSKQPCPSCPSSDAYSIYEDGHGYCFSCTKWTKPLTDNNDQGAQDVNEDIYTYQYVPWRGVTEATMRFFNVQTKVDAFGKPLEIAFPYSETALKVRRLDKKEFYSKGDMKDAGLFGADRFSSGSAKAITITEGELDCLSAFQLLGSAYPTVSIRTSSSAQKDCTRQRDYLNSFERIYLCLDDDEPGRKATREVASLFDFNKVYHVKLSKFKDANGYLEAGLEKEFKSIWYNSQRFLPEGVISSKAEFEKIIDDSAVKQGVPYPFPELNRLSYGIRTGEVTLITAMEGIGKTEVVRAIEAQLLRSTEDNLGIIHLEESKSRTLKGLAGYHLEAPVHLPDSGITNGQVKEALAKIIGRDERLHLYSHFGSSDPDIILDIIRFLASACKCKYIVLDHITMVVSGLADEDERKALDYISTRLAMMVEELDFALILVSHVNDEGRTRGSRNISKIAGLWVHLDRNQQENDPVERNTTYLTIRKNRFAGPTGPAGRLYFDPKTFMVTERDDQVIHTLPPIENS